MCLRFTSTHTVLFKNHPNFDFNTFVDLESGCILKEFIFIYKVSSHRYFSI